MTSFRFDNYLKAYRKRSGLTQDEIAFLLGFKRRATVSRYEQRRRLPSLRAAFACCSIVGISAEKLFVGVQQSAAAEVARRIEQLLSTLAKDESRLGQTSRYKAKLRSLNDCKGRVLDNKA